MSDFRTNRGWTCASWCAILALSACALAGCSHSRISPKAAAAACDALAKNFSAEDDAFVARARSIRMRHIRVQDYDRLMIDAIRQRRAALEATTLPEMTLNDDVEGCSGDPLDDLRRRAHEEMMNLLAYLNDFNRALKYDPPDVFIDEP